MAPKDFKTPPIFEDPLLELSLSALMAILIGFSVVNTIAILGYQLLNLPFVFVIRALCAFAAIAIVLCLRLPWLLPLRRFGAANSVTLVRAGLTTLLLGLIGSSSVAIDTWMPSVIALSALCLDGLDGWLARHEGSVTAFGARFDMEIDALFILVLALLLLQTGKTGPWIIVLGGLRYGFAIMGLLLPWLRAPLPPRKWRQTVCVIQALVLIVCLTPWIGSGVATALAVLTLGLVFWSFATDTRWLWRHALVNV